MENEKIFELMSKMYAEMQQGFKKVDERFEKVETEVKKNSILLEKVDSNVKLLAEGQESFRNQIGRNNNDDKRSINDRLDVIELAVSNTSKTLEQRFDKLSEKIDDLQIDVNTTTSKAVRTENKVIEFERRLDGKMQG